MGCRYELFMDDLPVWGFVGPPPEETKDEEHIYIYTHKSFDINYNDNRVRAPSLSHSPVICMSAEYQTDHQRHRLIRCKIDLSQDLPCILTPAQTEW